MVLLLQRDIRENILPVDVQANTQTHMALSIESMRAQVWNAASAMACSDIDALIVALVEYK